MFKLSTSTCQLNISQGTNFRDDDQQPYKKQPLTERGKKTSVQYCWAVGSTLATRSYRNKMPRHLQIQRLKTSHRTVQQVKTTQGKPARVQSLPERLNTNWKNTSLRASLVCCIDALASVATCMSPGICKFKTQTTYGRPKQNGKLGVEERN